jgi:hypothetical protein
MNWKPLHFLAVAVAGWMDRQQQDAIIQPDGKGISLKPWSHKGNPPAAR